LTLDTVQGWFGVTRREAARAYRAFIDAGVDEPHERPPLERAIGTGTMAEIAFANRRHGYPLREIAAVVGVSAATLSRRLRSETLVPGTDVSAGQGSTEP